MICLEFHISDLEFVVCGISTAAVHQLPKLRTRVRLPYPAQVPEALERGSPVGRSKARSKGGPLKIMNGIVYILQSLSDGRTYVGSTNNLSRRLKQHNSGQVKSTKHRLPLKILFIEKFQTLSEARKRENWWKSGAGRNKLKEYFKSLQNKVALAKDGRGR